MDNIRNIEPSGNVCVTRREQLVCMLCDTQFDGEEYEDFGQGRVFLSIGVCPPCKFSWKKFKDMAIRDIEITSEISSTG